MDKFTITDITWTHANIRPKAIIFFAINFDVALVFTA